MVGVRYMICHWATNRTDSQNLLSMTLDVPLQALINLVVLQSAIKTEVIVDIVMGIKGN